MPATQSADGTKIAYESTGSGPALILVGGAFNVANTAAAISEELAPHFTVLRFDRRGRGESGDTPPFAVAREVEDLAALIDAAGGSALVYGHSSGAILSLEAAASGLAIDRLVAYEPPFNMPGTRPALPDDFAGQVRALVEAGQLDDAMERFLIEGVLMPPEVVAGIRQSPGWAGMRSVAPTLVYDLTIVGDGALPDARLRTINVPTLVLDGGASPQWIRTSAAEVAALVPGAGYETLAGQDHGPANDILVPRLVEFFTA